MSRHEAGTPQPVHADRARHGPTQSPSGAAATDVAEAYEFDDLRFTYAAERRPDVEDGPRWALGPLSGTVRTGEVFGIIGPNGSGKSSLLKLLARVLTPQTGSIRVLGRPLQGLRQDTVARLVALVPQDSLQVFSFSVAEIVLMGRFAHQHRPWSLGGWGWETGLDLELARAAMEEMDIGHLARRPIGDLSGGERQRAIIARALAQQPSLLLLDEPTAFLDLNHQVEICRILRRLNDTQGLTVVLVSHDLNLASQYCDRLMLLKHGRPVLVGSARDVIRQEILESVYGCRVLIDPHPTSGLPRVTLPGREGTEDSGRTVPPS